MVDEVYQYQIVGQGVEILFLPGWGNAKETWLPLVSLLKNKYQCIMLDLPGFGKANKPDYPFAPQDYATFVKNFLINNNLNPQVLIGHSFGGKVITEMVLGGYDAKVIYVSASIIKPKTSLSKLIKKVRVKILKKLRIEYQQLGSKDYRDSQGIMRAVLIKATHTYYDHELTRIAVPVLVCFGLHDTETPLWMGKKISKLIKHSQFKLLDGGHFAHLEQPYIFATYVDKFIMEGK